MEFLDRIELKQHGCFQKVEKHPADECWNSYSQEYNMVLDDQINSSIKPYKCDECSKTFWQRIQLNAHKRGGHNGEKPFKCDECPRSFTKNSVLKAHKKTHSGEKPFKCNQCSQRFTKNSNLTVHKRMHSGEKPFKCEICSKSFARNANLTVHKRVHSGEKPYQCNECSKRFKQSTHLAMHKRLHTGEKRYNCSHCSESFTYNIDLKKHEKLHNSGWNVYSKSRFEEIAPNVFRWIGKMALNMVKYEKKIVLGWIQPRELFSGGVLSDYIDFLWNGDGRKGPMYTYKTLKHFAYTFCCCA